MIENFPDADRSAFQKVVELRTRDSHDEASALGQQLQRNLDNPWDQMAGFLSALATGDWESGYAAYVRALELSPYEVFAETVRNFSAELVLTLNETRREDDLAQRLEELWSVAPGMNAIPSGPGPEARRTLLRERQAALANGLPALLFIPMGGSASASIGSMLAAGFGLPCCTYGLINQRIIPSWATDYQLGGAFYATHLRAHPSVLHALEAAGPWRPVVHLRDPRQSFVSRMFYYLNDMPYIGDLAKTGFYDAEVSRQVELFIDTHWERSISWAADWLEASHRLEITFVHYEEFVADREAFLTKVIRAAGAPLERFNWDVIDTIPTAHFRKGALEEWREILTPEQTARVNSRITPEMTDRFGWEH